MIQAQDFLAESEAVYQLVAALSEQELEQRTLFKDWSINEIIGHLHMWNWAADLSLRNAQEFQKLWIDVQQHIQNGGTLHTFESSWLDGMRGENLLSTWRDYYQVTAEHFAAADPSVRVPWAGPSMSARSSITARLMETWAHAQAIYDVLGQQRVDQDRIRNIAVLGVNTYGWTFKNRNLAVPEPMPYVRLDAPSGDVWEFGDATQSDQAISGPATAFCQVVTQTRNIADVDLVVRGENAEQWMQYAQCFAGPPEDPPAPGARRIS